MNHSSGFIDSNVWLYWLLFDPISNVEAEARKHNQAIDLIGSTNPVISTQIVNEVCSILKRKGAFDENQIKQTIEAFDRRCTITQLTYETLIQASNLRIRYGFSFWDGLIVASALAADVAVLYSEDMQDGLVVADRLQIVNPFQ
jgi:predicted nucleic acid-binding protein